MYEPTLKSVKQHRLPDWYADAKFGIFIHWGLYSVPAFAPKMTNENMDWLFSNGSMGATPYAEWYQNSMRIKGSPAHHYHLERYGADYEYNQFAPRFNRLIQDWDPEKWSALFQRAGAKYVVLTAKHHDGFLLWPSQHPNPIQEGYQSSRDLVGELKNSVQGRGMMMGLYYSSLLDWTFTQKPIRRLGDLMTVIPTSSEYRSYVENHWTELIERYKPWILWGDIGYPPGADPARIFAHFYNRQPEGVVNDRWMQLPAFLANPVGGFLMDGLMKMALRQSAQSDKPAKPRVPHYDFATTEYSHFLGPADFKWEVCRGIGSSFGFNQFATADEYSRAPDLIRLLVEVVSANGNLLLNVGPRPDGSLHEAQAAALEGVGRWLAANGEAIYATRPWGRMKDEVQNGGQVHYTVKGPNLYVLMTKIPASEELVLPDLRLKAGVGVLLLSTGQKVRWIRREGQIHFELPEGIQDETVPVLRMTLAES